jgi:hypothetical protein
MALRCHVFFAMSLLKLTQPPPPRADDDAAVAGSGAGRGGSEDAAD